MRSVSPVLAMVILVVGINPLRLAGRLPPGRVAALGALITAGAYLGLGMIADPLLEAIDVSAPTMRVAAGLVLIAGAARDLMVGPPAAEPALSGWQRAIVPVTVPMLLRPHIGILAVSVGASDGLVPLMVGVAVAVAVAVYLARPIDDLAARIAGWTATTAACIALAGGVVLAVDGVFSV